MRTSFPYHLLRISLAVVFLFFGIGKFQNDIWADTMRNMPIFHIFGTSPDLWIYAVGVIELIIAASFIFNRYTQFFAGFASLELLSILFLLHFGETRDIGLLGATLALFFWKNTIHQSESTSKKKLMEGSL